VLFSCAGAEKGARDFVGRVTLPPRRETEGLLLQLALLMAFESRNTTMTVISSWKWRLTPRSIFLRSEYLISLFLAASCIATFTSLRAIPWWKEITFFKVGSKQYQAKRCMNSTERKVAVQSFNLFNESNLCYVVWNTIQVQRTWTKDTPNEQVGIQEKQPMMCGFISNGYN